MWSGGKRQPYFTLLWKRVSNSLLPDVLKGKPEMHWNRVRPHHKGEIQQRLKHDFLRKSIKSIAESWEGVVGKSNSILSEFLLLFPSVLTLASCVGERILAQVALTDTARFCVFALCCCIRGRHYLTKRVVLKATWDGLKEPTKGASKINRNADIHIWNLGPLYMKMEYLLFFFALKTTGILYVLTTEKIKQIMEYKMIQKVLNLSLSFIQL